jgi:hypothetical protein
MLIAIKFNQWNWHCYDVLNIILIDICDSDSDKVYAAIVNYLNSGRAIAAVEPGKHQG